MRTRAIIKGLALCVIVSAVASPWSEVEGVELPLWEAGAGLALLTIPDYRGSDEQRPYLLPFPYLVYRGDDLKVDGARIRGFLFRSDAVKFDVSLNASVPVRSGENEARRGMPDLDPTGEIGPSLEILLARDREADYKVTVTVPLRAIFAVSLWRVRQVGWISSPRLNVDVFGVSPWKINLGLSTGPVFGDRSYHDYFYSVDPEFATPDREAYSAPGGYSGTQLTLSASKRVAKWWFGAFVRGDFLSGAAFRQSPLLKARESVMAGVSVSWSFAESTTLVTVDE